MGLEYSADAYLSLPIFLGGYQELHVYVEDEAGLHLHESLLLRLLPKLVRFDNIHATSGKSRLKEVFHQHVAKPDAPRLFIADLDLDPLIAAPQVNHDSFVYLQRYSIENYLVDEAAATVWVKGRFKSSRESAAARINFSTWLTIMGQQFHDLIILYAICQILNLEVPNTAEKVSNFQKAGSWEIDPAKVQTYRNRVVNAYKRKGHKDFVTYYETIDKRLQASFGAEEWRAIPGRQLLDCFMRYLESLCHVIPKGDFQAVSAEVCSLEPLKYIRFHAAAVLAQSQGQAVTVEQLRLAEKGASAS